MKKCVCLLFSFLFVLSGCSSEITPKKAEDVVNDIKMHEYNPDSVSVIKVKYKGSYQLKGTNNRQLIDNSAENSYTYELSSRFNYIHIVSNISNKDKIEKTSNESESETWIYMKKKVLYKAHRSKSKGSETKTYTKVEKYSDAIQEFSKEFDKYLAKVVSDAQGKSFCDVDSLEELLGNEKEAKISYAMKFYSSGYGNLRIIGAAKCEEYEMDGVPATGVGTIACNWNKYLLKNANIAFTLNANDGTNKNDLKYSVGINEKVSSLVIPKYPKLSNFAEGNSISIFRG